MSFDVFWALPSVVCNGDSGDVAGCTRRRRIGGSGSGDVAGNCGSDDVAGCTRRHRRWW
jgi:hypothetical protein